MADFVLVFFVYKLEAAVGLREVFGGYSFTAQLNSERRFDKEGKGERWC